MSKPLNCAHIVIKAFQDFVQVPFNVALKNKTSEDVSLLVIDSIVDGNENFNIYMLMFDIFSNIFHRHHPELSHDLRGSGGRGRQRPKSHPRQLS